MTTREPIRAEGAPAAAGAYSQAIRAGDLVFTAGQLGIDPVTGQLREGIAAQAEQALRNVAAILEAGESGLDRLVKVTVYLADIGDWPVLNEVYTRLVPEPFPARSAFAVRDLPLGGLVEIEAVAVAGVG
jgi:2-iminobutanoate/2-iminopropanoate deaminase